MTLLQAQLLSVLEVFQILSTTLITVVRGPYRLREVIQHMYTAGVTSVPIIIVSTGFAGFVVTSEMGFHMNLALNTTDMLPGFSAQFVFRELGIAIPSLLLVAKVGAAITAEVSSMKVTEQIDALKLLQIDPIRYLVYPRFVACVLVSACLILISIFVTLGCAIAVALFKYNFTLLEYLNALANFISFRDLVWALVKGMTFGAVIPIISCFYGFRCNGGAEGVGSATTNSVVASTIIIIVLDFILTFVFAQFS